MKIARKTKRLALAGGIAAVVAGAFFSSRDGLTAPDMQVHFAPSGFWDNGMHEPTTRKATVGPTLVRVASRGQLRLRSTDPRWHPEIDPRYYDDPAGRFGVWGLMQGRSW